MRFDTSRVHKKHLLINLRGYCIVVVPGSLKAVVVVRFHISLPFFGRVA